MSQLALDDLVRGALVKVSVEWREQYGGYDLVRSPDGVRLYEAYVRQVWREGSGDKLTFGWYHSPSHDPFLGSRLPYIIVETVYSDYDHRVDVFVVEMEQHTCAKCGETHTAWPQWLREKHEEDTGVG